MRILGGPLAVITAALLVLGGAATVPAANASGFVEKAQTRLNKLGCNAGPVDGKLGEHTRAAIVRFQATHRLAQDGHLTDRTRARLYSDKARRCDRRAVPAKSGAGRRIVISQRQNWVWLVRGDGRIAAQGGMIDNPGVLPRGTTYTGSYCGRPARVENNSDYSGRLKLENFVRFYPCGVGFHRIPIYRSGGGQIHPDWLLGTDYRESSGCIRLGHRFSERLWDFTVKRTKVVVIGG